MASCLCILSAKRFTTTKHSACAPFAGLTAVIVALPGAFAVSIADGILLVDESTTVATFSLSDIQINFVAFVILVVRRKVSPGSASIDDGIILKFFCASSLLSVVNTPSP